MHIKCAACARASVWEWVSDYVIRWMSELVRGPVIEWGMSVRALCLCIHIRWSRHACADRSKRPVMWSRYSWLRDAFLLSFLTECSDQRMLPYFLLALLPQNWQAFLTWHQVGHHFWPWEFQNSSICGGSRNAAGQAMNRGSPICSLVLCFSGHFLF